MFKQPVRRSPNTHPDCVDRPLRYALKGVGHLLGDMDEMQHKSDFSDIHQTTQRITKLTAKRNYLAAAVAAKLRPNERDGKSCKKQQMQETRHI